jgi:hypothetical protein
MGRLIEVGGDVFVNPDHVTSITVNDDGATVVALINSTAVTSTLSVGEVVDRLEGES